MRQVLVLAETLNYRAAAERLHMAQPPLSVSIRKLEEEIGTPLFDRSRAGVRLTAAGRAVLEHARRTLYHAEQFRQSAQLAVGGHVGTLRIEYVASSTIRLLPRAIAHFRAAYPVVDLQLLEGSTDSIMRALRDGRTDVGIVRYPTLNVPSIAMATLQRDRYVLALPAGHPKAARAGLKLGDMRDEPFIFPAREQGSGAYMAALLACQGAGFMPNIVQQATHAQSIVALVESGLGVALVPDVWEHLAARSVVFRNLVGMGSNTTGLALACRQGEQDAVLIANFRASVQHEVAKAR
jgi:DNA-binding transcriptional LysR family regulator